MLKNLFLLSSLLFAATASSGVAKDESGEMNVRLAIVECANIAQDIQRMACYDGLATKTKNAMMSQGMASAHAPMSPTATPVASEDPVPPNAPTINRPDTLPQAGIAVPQDQKSEPIPDKFAPGELLSYTLDRASKDANNDWIFYFKNGQVWKQSDTRRRRMPDLPAVATLKEGSFGSHRMKIEGKSWSMKVKRLK